jgi:hypothetical protein
MNEYNLYDGGSGSMAMEYPKSDNNGSVSDASTIPKDGDHLEEGLVENVERYQIENPKLARALTVVKEYCAIGRESKSAEDGRQAVRMAIYNVGERDIANVRVILASFGIFAVDMTDIDAMGIHDPEGHPKATQGAEREKKILYIRSETEKRKKQNKLSKRRGPQWDSSPRGYEQGIGPNHLRKGRREPSSCAYDRGHRGYKHWDRIWAMAPRWGLNPRGHEQGIGPGHLRKGRHEPSSHACDRGHRGCKL